MQEVADGVKHMAVFFLPIWVSWTALTKGPNQGRGRELEYPSGKLLMICAGRIQVPEVNLISSTKQGLVEKTQAKAWRDGLHASPNCLAHFGLCWFPRAWQSSPAPFTQLYLW